jgi:hypothetical protein
MMALTQEAGFRSPKVEFSVYQLCRIVGWPIDGRSYQRVEDSMSRIAGTTLQFRDAWYDKGEREFKSKTFHLIDEVDLRSRDQIERARRRPTGQVALSSFVWNQVIWKSFQDGYIRRLNMEMFRRIARGRRRDVPIRLFRILDKRFHRRSTAKFPLERLAVGILGLSPRYAPSQMRRIINRAGDWLIKCGYLADYHYSDWESTKNAAVIFRKRQLGRRTGRHRRRPRLAQPCFKSGGGQERRADDAAWFSQKPETEWRAIEDQALEVAYGTELERNRVREERAAGKEIASSGALRRHYVRSFYESTNGVDSGEKSTAQYPE